jgi:phage-related protein
MPPLKLHPKTCMACLGCPGYRVEPCGFCGGNQAADANAPTADPIREALEECHQYFEKRSSIRWSDPLRAKVRAALSRS